MVKRLSEWVLAIDGTSLLEKSLVGGKAWSIAEEMSALGLNVPPACSENVRSLVQILRPGNIVKGRVFSNDCSLVRIAIERGAASIVTRPVLPALLAAAHAAQETGKPE
jgi:phosphoenolpyruvate synthase/pyruvate phosphate dikinase